MRLKSIILLVFLSFSVYAQEEQMGTKSTNVNALLDSLEWTNQKENVYLYFDGLLALKIERQDIKSLLNILESKEKCKCLLNPYSSYIPIEDFAELGGIAALFIESYKKGIELDIGRYTCPKVNEVKNQELRIWWRENLSD